MRVIEEYEDSMETGLFCKLLNKNKLGITMISSFYDKRQMNKEAGLKYTYSAPQAEMKQRGGKCGLTVSDEGSRGVAKVLGGGLEREAHIKLTSSLHQAELKQRASREQA